MCGLAITNKRALGALVSSALLWALFGAQTVAANDDPDHPATDFRSTDLVIFNADGDHIIGHAHYAILPTRDANTELLRGESAYSDGQYDVEISRLHLSFGGQAPTLVSYEHLFFNADRSLQRASNLDARSGAGSCKTYLNGELEERRSSLTVPADTYAGAAQVMFVVNRLRQGMEYLKFNSFSCAPGPRIIAVKAWEESQRASWSMYPGELVQLEIAPDFGWFDLLVAPFFHKTYVWLDPHDSWRFVGGVYDRYYRGPRILTVRARPAA